MSHVTISTNQKLFDLKLIHRFISQSYWAKGISFELVKRSVENSLCFGAYTQLNQQVGFARIITDKATFAYLADVFVLEDYRGQGVSRLLMGEIIGHPDLQGLRRIMLATQDAHGLYEKYGFVPVTHPESLMQKWEPTIYQK